MEVTFVLSLAKVQKDLSDEPHHHAGKTWWVATSLSSSPEKVSAYYDSVESLKGSFSGVECRVSP